jgi:hypothetical protein
MLITLDPWEYSWACHVGIERFTANWQKNDARHYDRNLMEDDRTAQQAAAICELAVAKATNRYWSGHYWPAQSHDANKHLADVGTNIEVRRVRTGQTAAVRRRQLNLGLILFAAHLPDPEFRTVEVWGWITMEEAWALGQPATYDPENTRLIHRSELVAI